MDQQPTFEAFTIWYKTMLRPPPNNEWFMGRYANQEIMPTFIIGGSVCLSVRLYPEEGRFEICQHQLALPPEWRP